MPKRRIKLKDLAHELGLTSRELLDRCRAEGVNVQNSITKLRIEQERLVRSWYPTGGEVQRADAATTGSAGSTDGTTAPDSAPANAPLELE